MWLRVSVSVFLIHTLVLCVCNKLYYRHRIADVRWRVCDAAERPSMKCFFGIGPNLASDGA